MKWNPTNSNKKRKITYTFIFLVVVLLLIIIPGFYKDNNALTDRAHFDWKGVRPEIRDSILKLDQYGSLMRDENENDPEVSQQCHRQQWILENASESELHILTGFPSGTVKGLAYEGLLSDTNGAQYELLVEVLNDTLSFIRCEAVCNGKMIMLSDYVINQISDIKYPGMGDKPIEITLTEPQRREIIAMYYQRRDRQSFYRKEYLKLTK